MHQGVLFANDVFYGAFAAGDLAAMEELWATEAPVACIHPGWAPLTTRSAIMESWRRILSGASRPNIACRDARAFLFGDVAFVICYEQVDGSLLIATNVFLRRRSAWKIVHHQAGPTSGSPADENEAHDPSLH